MIQFKLHQNIAYILMPILILFGISQQASAVPITSTEEIIEVMIDAQTANITYLIRAFGNNQPPALDISFTSNTNTIGKSFSFFTDSGATFNGSALNLNVTGAYNSTSGAWDMTSAGQVGANTFSGTGSMVLDLSPTDPLIAAGANGSWLWGLLDYRSTVKITNNLGTVSNGDIIFTILGDDVGSITVHDQQIPADNIIGPYKYEWSITAWKLASPTPESPGVIPNGIIRGSGQLDSLTGNGTLQITIPEPSTIALLGIGVAGFSFTRKKKS